MLPPSEPAPENIVPTPPAASTPFGSGIEPERPREVVAMPLSGREARAPAIDVQARTLPPQPSPAPQPVPPPYAVPPSYTATPEHAAHVPPPPAPPVYAAPPPPASPPAPELARPAPRRKSRVWAVFCHLALFLVIPTIFLGGVITFFLWQVFGKDDPQLEDQGREALNFQINVAIVTALLALSCLGIALVPITWFVAGVLAVVAALHAGRGENYRYPLIVRVVKH